jgi:hypothetical protein
MPFLMVNLDDPADCRRALQHLRPRVQRAAAGPQRCGPGPAQGPGWGRGAAAAGGVAGLPLGQKLRRIRHRGLWQHLVKIARATEQPRSLMEWDEVLGLPANKMRSLKAIMAKLENRFGIRFLQPAADGGVDAAGNPRYAMVPRVRQVILRIAAEDAA